MAGYGSKAPLTFLGSLRGSGGLRVGDAAHDVSPVAYEIDCYRDAARAYADGWVHGDPRRLAEAFAAGGARIALEGGRTIDVVLSDPDGGSRSEIAVSGPPPPLPETHARSPAR